MYVPEPMSKTEIEFCYNFKCGYNNKGLCPFHKINIGANGFCTKVSTGAYQGKSIFKVTTSIVQNCNSLNCDFNKNVECTRKSIKLGYASRCMSRTIEKSD